jgi:hypothetical protein
VDLNGPSSQRKFFSKYLIIKTFEIRIERRIALRKELLEKEAYEASVIEIVRFDRIDVITTSGGTEDTGTSGPVIDESNWDTWT